MGLILSTCCRPPTPSTMDKFSRCVAGALFSVFLSRHPHSLSSSCKKTWEVEMGLSSPPIVCVMMQNILWSRYDDAKGWKAWPSLSRFTELCCSRALCCITEIYLLICNCTPGAGIFILDIWEVYLYVTERLTMRTE